MTEMVAVTLLDTENGDTAPWVGEKEHLDLFLAEYPHVIKVKGSEKFFFCTRCKALEETEET